MSVRFSIHRSDALVFEGVTNTETAVRQPVLRGTAGMIGPLGVTRLLAKKTNAGGADVTFRLYNALAGGVELAQIDLTDLTSDGEWDSMSFNPPLVLEAEEPLYCTAEHSVGGDHDYDVYAETVAAAR